MQIAAPSKMKLSSVLALLFLVIAAMIATEGAARRCTGVVSGRRRRGVCAPRSVCRGRPFRAPAAGCFGGTGCCIGGVLRCPRNRSLFVTLAQDCRRGNDRGPVGGDAPGFIRCCRNAPPRR